MTLLSILEELRDFDTALLANTLGYIDPTPPEDYYMAGTIRSVTPTIEPTVGVAFTCELDSSTPSREIDTNEYLEQVAGFYPQLEAMSRIAEPIIWVVKTVGSRPDHECVLGDGMAKALYAAGCIGVVTNGGVRDVKGLLTVPFAAYCKGTTIHHCALRFRSCNQPVEIGGIRIEPGDVIHANCEGVIKIPRSCLETLPEKAIQMRAFEHDAHRLMRRTDVSPTRKSEEVLALLRRYGFLGHATRSVSASGGDTDSQAQS
ncbi:MAG TPA: RraA family protein [Acidobacteriota bacterium]|nr:RraA family protein [Acidobacteriota bacterium]